MWFHELDRSRHEVRKVVVFPDGHSERAGLGEETDYAALGPEPMPTIEEINAQAEFRAEEISADLFEEAWKAAASPERETVKAESIAILERRIRPLLEAAAKDLRAAFPTARIRTESSSVGSKTRPFKATTLQLVASLRTTCFERNPILLTSLSAFDTSRPSRSLRAFTCAGAIHPGMSSWNSSRSRFGSMRSPGPRRRLPFRV